MSAPCPACGEPAPDRDAASSSCAACGADLQPLQLCGALADAEIGAAEGALRRGCFRAALLHLDRAAALRPPGDRERRLRGLALVGAGRPSAARTYLDGDEALLLTPALLSAEARYGAARALAQAGDPAGALNALAGGPATGDGLVLFALCALRLGDRGAAAAALQAALCSDPSNSHAAALLRL